MITIRRQQHVLREIDLHAVPFPDGDGGRNLHEAVKDRGRRLRDAGSGASGERLRTAGRDGSAALLDLACSGDDAQGDRSSEDFKVMVVNLVLQPLLADLVETVKLVEIDASSRPA